MIWMERGDRLQRDWGEWRPWFAWRPIQIRIRTSNIDYTYYRTWLQTILRKRGGGYWEYMLPNEDVEKLREQAEAVRLAPKYAKEIVLMDKIGG